MDEIDNLERILSKKIKKDGEWDELEIGDVKVRKIERKDSDKQREIK